MPLNKGDQELPMPLPPFNFWITGVYHCASFSVVLRTDFVHAKHTLCQLSYRPNSPFFFSVVLSDYTSLVSLPCPLSHAIHSHLLSYPLHLQLYY